MKSQKGSVVIIVLVFVIIGLIGAIGYLVYDRNQNNANTTTQQTKNVTQTSTEQNTKPNYSVRFVNPNAPEEYIDIQSVADISKLPSDFPEGAKQYLEKNITDVNIVASGDCQNTISINKYNDINIYGAVGCDPGGGAMAVWSINEKNEWQSLFFQDVPTCDDIKNKRIYNEFVDTCFEDKNSDGEVTEDEYISNPNGSSALL